MASVQSIKAVSTKEEPPKSLGELAYDRLLEMVLSGTLKAGTLLQEQVLADTLQISRTPVREAIVRLEAEGFVKRHAGRLLFVREMPVREFMEILHIRALLEGEAIVLACPRISDGTLADLRRVFEALLSNPNPDVQVQTKADEDLHGLIVDSCGNSVLADLVRSLRRRTRIFNLKSLPERFAPGCKEHLEIIGALERRDLEGARRALAVHLENVKQCILIKLGGV